MKNTLLIIILTTSLFSFSQEGNLNFFKEIYENGQSYTSSLKNGNIESLRKANPPKDTWVFSKLEDYKQNLGSKDILYGSIIMPSALANSNLYSYNLFAYDIKKESYYFVAIVSYEISGEDIKLSNAYLFTEELSLKDWWKKVFGFYQSKIINDIPQKYLYNTCPPPPYN